MKIALDYDKTFTKNPDFWNAFIDLAQEFDLYSGDDDGVEVRIVTARCPRRDNIDSMVPVPVIYCDGIAKRFYCRWLADDKKGWLPDIWIDDKPEGVDNNSTATEEILATWRESDEYKATTPPKG